MYGAMGLVATRDMVSEICIPRPYCRALEWCVPSRKAKRQWDIEASLFTVRVSAKFEPEEPSTSELARIVDRARAAQLKRAQSGQRLMGGPAPGRLVRSERSDARGAATLGAHSTCGTCRGIRFSILSVCESVFVAVIFYSRADAGDEGTVTEAYRAFKDTVVDGGCSGQTGLPPVATEGISSVIGAYERVHVLCRVMRSGLQFQVAGVVPSGGGGKRRQRGGSGSDGQGRGRDEQRRASTNDAFSIDVTTSYAHDSDSDGVQELICKDTSVSAYHVAIASSFEAGSILEELCKVAASSKGHGRGALDLVVMKWTMRRATDQIVREGQSAGSTWNRCEVTLTCKASDAKSDEPEPGRATSGAGPGSVHPYSKTFKLDLVCDDAPDLLGPSKWDEYDGSGQTTGVKSPLRVWEATGDRADVVRDVTLAQFTPTSKHGNVSVEIEFMKSSLSRIMKLVSACQPEDPKDLKDPKDVQCWFFLPLGLASGQQGRGDVDDYDAMRVVVMSERGFDGVRVDALISPVTCRLKGAKVSCLEQDNVLFFKRCKDFSVQRVGAQQHIPHETVQQHFGPERGEYVAETATPFG